LEGIKYEKVLKCEKINLIKNKQEWNRARIESKSKVNISLCHNTYASYTRQKYVFLIKELKNCRRKMVYILFNERVMMAITHEADFVSQAVSEWPNSYE
jgi:hypothetical protein